MVIVWRRSCVQATCPAPRLGGVAPEIERQQAAGKRVTFPPAAFAKPEIYEAMEERGVDYVIRIPANKSLELILVSPAGKAELEAPGALQEFSLSGAVGHRRGGSWPRSSITRANCSPIHRDEQACQAVVRFYNGLWIEIGSDCN